MPKQKFFIIESAGEFWRDAPAPEDWTRRAELAMHFISEAAARKAQERLFKDQKRKTSIMEYKKPEQN